MTKTSEDKACFTLRLPKKLHKKFHIYCLKKGTKMSILIRELVEQEMKN